MPPSVSDRTQPAVPERPSLEGLEAKWRARWEEDGTYALRPHQEPGRRLLHRHAAADGQRPPAHRPRLLATPTPTSSPATSACAGARSSTRWGGTTTACNVERRAQLHYGVICDPSLPVRPRLHGPSCRRPRRPARSRSRGPTSSSCAPSSPSSWRRSTSRPVSQVGLSVDWSYLYRTIGSDVTKISQLAFLRLPRPRRDLPRRRAHAVGRRHEDVAVAGRPRGQGDPGAYHRIRFSDIEIDTTRPELIPACVALVAHPDDARYQPRFGTTVRSPLFGVEVPVARPRAGRPREGHRHRHDLHVRRRHRRRVVARARPPGPQRHGARRSHLLAGSTGTTPARSRPTTSCAGKTAKQAQARIVELLRRVGRPHRRAPADHPRRSSSGSTAPARSRSSPRRQWFIRFPPKDDAARARPRAAVASRVHAGALRELGRGPGRRLEHHAGSGSSASRSRSGTRSATTARSTGRRRSPRRRGRACRSTRRPTRPRVTTQRSGASPAASSATPTSWTRGPRRR